MNFDTHKAVKFLIKSGIKEIQAEAIVEVINQSRNNNPSNLVTEDRLKLVENNLIREITALKNTSAFIKE